MKKTFLISLILTFILCIDAGAQTKTDTLPTRFDLRNVNGINYVSPIKSQKGGTCWTHGAMAAIEGNLMLTGVWQANEIGGPPDLAEYHLDWWNGFNMNNNDDLTPTSGSGLTVHQGGDYRVTSAYTSRGEGAVREVDANTYTEAPDRFNTNYHYYYVPTIQWYTNQANSIRLPQIKRAIMNHGVVGTCLYYNKIYFNSSLTAHYQPPSTHEDPNHAVAIIGWDDTIVTQAPNPGAWLCKNSWGVNWGLSGYFWIAYEDKHAGRHSEMGAVSFQDTEPMQYNHIYFHDYHGWRKTKKNCREAINKFTAKAAESLRAVSFFTAADSVNYSLAIYSQFDGNTLNEQLTSMSGFLPISGFHTIKLDHTASLEKDKAFYVYLQLSKGGQPYDCTSIVPVLLGTSEKNVLVSSSASPDQSYFKEASNWLDLTTFDETGNFCIKALTVDTTTLIRVADVTADWEEKVKIPVIIANLREAVSIRMKLDFDPAVLTYSNLLDQPDNTIFTAISSTGSLVITWTGSPSNPLSLENGKLFNIAFDYSGGNSLLEFDLDETSIELSDGTIISSGYQNGSLTQDRSEAINYLTHNAGNFKMSIFNEGSLGSDSNDPSDETGIYWKNLNGIYVGGLIFGTSARGSVNGLLGSFKGMDASLVTDFKNIASRFSAGLVSDETFDQISRTVYTDENAAHPYGVTVIQTACTNIGNNFGLIRYGFINTTNELIKDFHAGIFMDWDVGAYNNNSGGYSLNENLTYVYNPDNQAWFGISALDSLSGFGVTDKRNSLGDGDGVRKASFNWLTTRDTEIPANTDLRAWTGSKVGNIAPRDTAWVTFALVGGDDLADLLVNTRAASSTAGSLNWVKDKFKQPERNFLYQNYPNPFNSATTIDYLLEVETKVQLNIYNLLGRKVLNLVSEKQSAGLHTCSFNSGSLASGLYFYKLEAKTFTKTKKLIILR